MKTHYDREADALYIRFGDAPVAASDEVAPGIVLDFDDRNRLVAIEVLNASITLTSGEIPTAAE